MRTASRMDSENPITGRLVRYKFKDAAIPSRTASILATLI